MSLLLLFQPQLSASTVRTNNQTALARIALNRTATQLSVTRIANNLTKLQTVVTRLANNKTKTQSSTSTITNSMSTLYDNFNSNVLNTSLWSTATSGDASQVKNQNQRIEITHTAAPQYNAINSVKLYSLIGSSAYVQVVDVGNQTLGSHQAIFGLILDVNNSIYFNVIIGQLQAWKNIAGVRTQIGANVTYSSTAHQWWRIRESVGTIFYDTSPDSITWTNQWTLLNPFILTSLSPLLQSGCYATEVSGSYTYFDNFNTSNSSKSQTTVSRLANNLGKSQSALARLANNLTKNQPVISRISKNTAKIQIGVSRIQTNRIATISAVANIAGNSSKIKTQLAVAHITSVVTKTQLTTARIVAPVTKLQPSTARIAVNSNNYPRINQFLNPSFEVNITDSISVTKYNASSMTVTRDTTKSVFGTASIRYNAVDTFVDDGTWTVLNLDTGSYTLSAYMATASSGTGGGVQNAHFVARTSIGQSFLAGVHVVSDTVGVFSRYSISFILPVPTSIQLLIGLGSYGSSSQGSLWVDGILVEQRASLLPYFDGRSSLSSWTGAADNSTSIQYLGQQPAVARIVKNLTKPQPALANIITAVSSIKTQPAITRIAKNISVTIPATARISKNYSKTQFAVARIVTKGANTQTSITRIVQSTQSIVKIETATARIAVNLTKSQPGISRVQTIRSTPQPIITRISNNLTKTQPTLSRITIIVSKTQPATARTIFAYLKSTTQLASAHIVQNYVHLLPITVIMPKPISILVKQPVPIALSVTIPTPISIRIIMPAPINLKIY